MKILRLTLKKKWFELIAIGKKTKEFRKIKTYWINRLTEDGFVLKQFDEIHFRNGYRKDSPFMRVICLAINISKHTDVFVIHLGKILEVRNWKYLNK